MKPEKDDVSTSTTPETRVENPERGLEPKKEDKDGTADEKPDLQTDGESIPSISASRKSRLAKSILARSKLRRERHPEGLPPVVIPEWFWSKNVRLFERVDEMRTLSVYADGKTDVEDEKDMLEMARRADLVTKIDLPPTKDARYSLDVDVYQEILATVRAGLSLRPPRTGKDIMRPPTVLECPKDGASYYLDSIVETISNQLGADLIRLDAQDIALIVGPYVDENLAWTFSTTSLLGYNAQKEAGKVEDYDEDPVPGQEESVDYEDDMGSLFGGRPSFLNQFQSSVSSKVHRRHGSKSKNKKQPPILGSIE